VTRVLACAAAAASAVLCAGVAGAGGAGAATATRATTAGAAGATAAPSISVDRACYVTPEPSRGAPMTITGSGFTPGETISIAGGSVSAQATVAADGTLTVTTRAPELRPGPRMGATRLTATDTSGTTHGLIATTRVRSANLAVAETTGRIGDGRVRFSISGFTPGKRVHAFYLWHRRVVARAAFGRARGPCGVLVQRALPYPGGRPTHSVYKVVFESQSRYRSRTYPMVTGRLRLLPG
jgi:hypothetical protein